MARSAVHGHTLMNFEGFADKGKVLLCCNPARHQQNDRLQHRVAPRYGQRVEQVRVNATGRVRADAGGRGVCTRAARGLRDVAGMVDGHPGEVM
ncbi:hypothetical protein DICSQDRAFT_156113 [Dichomitus squalens LYAD-421 SS1]|uniref:Uncharacterized protein n=2 Tax=Dichomitus squalens TaxID=114155 RepID=A0A4Q9N1E3_9APHY|nr:uncharacterized protein DICSQDRAFT_156113 [Dichomitus squalens LYAD-421 SS1]EJF59781.1 hypothetical protein DICSQDRAFT_156113 [Dichomitus squalens LYAD-421 SS1]TBU34300.1 hypothetical protein BD311DRAFT_650938 [Dichomitus squalens]